MENNKWALRPSQNVRHTGGIRNSEGTEAEKEKMSTPTRIPLLGQYRTGYLKKS